MIMAERSSRVLVVDDDCDIVDQLKYNLEKEGFKVKTLEKSHKTIRVAKAFCPDLIILDIMMPHPNGIELCRELRSMKRFTDTYIFFLTAKSESYYQYAALNTGGDDYIEKIVGLRALTYKVKSVLKKHFIIRKGVPELKIGSLTICRKTNSVHFRDHEVILNKPEFELLFFFAQNHDKLISSDNLIGNIWGSEIYLFDTSIDIYIDNLKRKFGSELIQRLHDNRYRFVIN
jgi:two-component system, OmpR family, alkaline phosphatase synthesis response regulator PhoP